MDFRTEQYMGYTIRAYAYPAPNGFLPAAIIALTTDIEKKIKVMPPTQAFDDAAQAVESAIFWARDRVDELFGSENPWRMCIKHDKA
jgi:hypothetical protein